MRKIINVVSGKGGTGKTLFCAVLADMLGNSGARVLSVDLDVFVRGLTTLLYFQKNETIRITEPGEVSVSDLFRNIDKHTILDENKCISICRYRSFDVLPSVSKVDEILNFKDIMPNSINDAQRILQALISSIPEKYDYVFLDSRAGYDELIAATHMISDFSICVEEDDNISMVTSDNLIAQLKTDCNTPVLRIRNKVRHYDRKKNSTSQGISFVGSIPFDADVMNSFGTDSFWVDINRSVYKEAVCEAWNNLAKKMELATQLKSFRVSPLGNSKIERRLSILSISKRISFIYGLIFVMLGWYLTLEGEIFLDMLQRDPVRIMGIASCVVGVLLVTMSVTNNK